MGLIVIQIRLSDSTSLHLQTAFDWILTSEEENVFQALVRGKMDAAMGEMGISQSTAHCYKMLRCVGIFHFMACMYSSVLLLVKIAQIPQWGLVLIKNNHIHCDSA